MTRIHLNQLHPADVPLWFAVEAAVWRLADAANCHLRSVSPVPRSRCEDYAGLFHYAPVSCIQISLRQRKNGQWKARFPLHCLLDTIAHEVAHAVVGRENGRDHGPKFFRTFAKALELAEDLNLRYELQSSRVSLRD